MVICLRISVLQDAKNGILCLASFFGPNHSVSTTVLHWYWYNNKSLYIKYSYNKQMTRSDKQQNINKGSSTLE